MEKLNRDLILRTKKTVLSKDFISYAKDDPTLGRLHPLARAFASIVYTIPGFSEEGVRELRRRGLNTCWLSGKVQADREYHLEEYVHHVLEKKIGKLKLLLEFSSRGDAYFCGRGAYLEVRPQLFYTPLCLNRLDKEFARTSSELLIDYWKKYANAGPVSYPEDSGSQIGGYQINLTKINGVSVEGPTLSNNGVETEWNLLADGADSDIDDHDQPDSFCPFHYMTLDQASAIGIAPNLQVPPKMENSEHSTEYPDWLPKNIRNKQYWITEKDLDASFRNGVVIPEMLHFYIGPNEQWSPEDVSAKPIYSSQIIGGSKSNATVTDLIKLLAELVA